MAAPAGTFKTYEAIGNREDLTDAIYNISPTDTPFLQRVPRVKAKARTHEWQTDSLATAGTNVHLEGDDSSIANGETSVPTVRVGNRCQIFKKTIQVSGTQETVDKAGRDSEIAYQLMKRGKELKRDIEWALTQNQASALGDASSVRRLGSVETWLSTNYTDRSSGTATYVTAGYSSGTGNTIATVTKTHLGSFSEADLKSVIAACWTQGGQPDLILVGPNGKRRISGFTGIADITKEAGTTAKMTRIIGGADIYVSDFGEHRVVPSRFSRDQTVLILDMDFWAVAQLRGMTKEKLAKTGDSEKWHLLTELTLESRQEAASGKIDGVNGLI
jgi:hypothetical protein